MPLISGNNRRTPGATATMPNRERPPDMTTYKGRLGANVRARRKQLKLSQAALSKLLVQHGADVTVPALSNYEVGNRAIQLEHLPAFAKALETSIRKLMPES